ncbi:Retrovirus-related Pol polyprotein from transposon TNT 1-94 [Nymphaea thermarum]|nr:Retrovirus-related Pol polyprotein from transposon TNT 1-94 [Nymphaea thermarum]
MKDMGEASYILGQQKLNIPLVQPVSSLMYLMLCTRPDISFPIAVVNHYQSNLGWSHWQAVKRTKGLKLSYQVDELTLVDYFDVDFVDYKDDNKSTFKYVILFGGEAIAWSYKK